VALHRHPWSQVRPGVQRLAVSLLSKKGSGGYTAGGVPVTGALPELGLLNLPPLDCRRVALHRHPWSQVRPGVHRLGRFVSRGPWRRPQARKPKRPRVGLHPSLDEPALGGLGRSQRCAGRVADSDLHWKRQLTRAARRPQRPRPCQTTSAGPHALVALTSHLRPGPPRDPGRQTRVRCAYRAALGRRASNCAPPRLPASVALRSRQIRRSRNRAPEIWNLNTPR
jgi:hypothetical protein